AEAERPTWKPGEDPMRNATWEDWERWYRRNDEAPPQSPRYLSNAAFISVIVMFAALGGVGQATRANAYGQTVLDQRKGLNDKTHADLMRARATAKGATRDEKIERFLQRADPAVYADPGLRKMVLAPDVCESGNIEEGKGGYRQNRR
ncbi:MAG: hypothetical protein INR71_07600, partial [Terriglobus roseus]|nr:hypothetical protein [Terriglobus roseus]